MGKQEHTYIITLNENQAIVLSKALDVYSRLFAGQYDFLKTCISGFYTKKSVNVKKVNDLLDELKLSMFPELSLNAYYSILSPEIGKEPKISWDIHQTLRNKISWTENPEGSYTVDFDPPMKTSEEPLPIVEVKTKKSNRKRK